MSTNTPVTTKSAAITRPVGAAGGPVSQLPALTPRERVFNVWVPRVGSAVARTGRPGMVGIALLMASAVFLVSTHLPVMQQVAELRGELQAAQSQAHASTTLAATDTRHAERTLPSRSEVPALLATLLKNADESHLTLDTGKYEVTSAKSANIVRYQMAFPVSGSYPQIRQFIDATLQSMPEAAIDELSISRKAVGDGAVEAQIRMSLYTRASP